ncbi:MAG: pantetheine-phosphate adenylyltransferase [Anaerolineaceae bacterium]|nr:pantetheine-phosphate adenylyltransferase [Anaerolineaceae bacterium]
MSSSHLGLFPATLDPVHNGHIDIVSRAVRLFGEVVVGIYDSPKKPLLFDTDERVALACEAFGRIPNVNVAQYKGLTVDFASGLGAVAIIRGLRVSSDFDFELRTALANRQLSGEIETIAIMADERYIHVSSSIIREIAELGGDVSSMVPPHVMVALQQRFVASPK